MTLSQHILAAVSRVPVLRISDLRRSLPAHARGPVFDRCVLRLADERRVIISQDCDPTSAAGRDPGNVRDGRAVFTCISRFC
ncbi:MAG: hypothetical protein E6Q97_09545 [Desulfurellales bacterium]|nr:MAG: hypothetical protein E6Q97_09545 [Desulfurellales bacterium]